MSSGERRAWAHLFGTRPAARKGDWAEAATLADQARVLFRQAGDRYGERSALAQLGECHARLRNYDLARGHARQAIAAASEAGDPTNVAFTWNVLGSVHSQLGQHRQAITCYQQALALARQRETRLARRWLASLLARLGDACHAAGDLPAARQAWQQACRSATTWDCRTTAGSALGSSRPARPAGEADCQVGTYSASL